MYKRRQYPLKSFICFIIGVLIFVWGIGEFVGYIVFKKNAVEVKAVVSQVESIYEDGDLLYIPYVDYNYNEQEFKNVKLDRTYREIIEGEILTVSVNTKNPSRVMWKNSGAFLAVSKAVSGFILLTIMLFKKKQINSAY